MTIAVPTRETREVLIARAREAMRLAEEETTPNRARIHLQAAETWLKLAARKAKLEAREPMEIANASSIQSV